MIMESGMHIHFDKVAEVGKSATKVAIVGTFLPIVMGLPLCRVHLPECQFGAFLLPMGFCSGLRVRADFR